jgi:glycosyltransferase involved in cell wall biosynthesis
VVYVAREAFLEPGLSLVAALSHLVDVHFVLWVGQDSWGATLLSSQPIQLRVGPQPGDYVLPRMLPKAALDYLAGCAGTTVVGLPPSRALRPSSIAASVAFYSWLNTLGGEIVHLEDPGLPLAFGSGRLRRASLVADVHDPILHPNAATWRNKAYRALLFPRVDRFVLRSSGLRAGFTARYPVSRGRVSVAPLAPYAIARECAGGISPEPDHRPTVLFFGNLAPYKGLPVLLECVPRLRRSVPQARVIAAVRASSDAGCDGLRLPEGVQLIRSDCFSPEEVGSLFARCDIVALPYLSATQSGVLMTALAFGKPVVATRVGGLPEYVQDGETGLLVEAGRPDDLAGSLATLLGDSSRLTTMRRRIEAGATGLPSWNDIALRYVEVYERAVREGGRACP